MEKFTVEEKKRIQVLAPLTEEFKQRNKELRNMAEKYVKRALAYAIVQSLSKKGAMNTIELTMESYRCHGEEKLKRPACLKGLKPAWELPVIGKKCKVFELENGELMLHMGELFCKLMSFPEAEDMTLPTSALISKYPDRMSRKSVKGFVYADAWCTIYARNEGYVRIKGLRESLSDIFRLKLGPIYDAVYDNLRNLSLKDTRFLHLGLTGAEGADSAAYLRFCETLVGHYFMQERDKYKR